MVRKLLAGIVAAVTLVPAPDARGGWLEFERWAERSEWGFIRDFIYEDYEHNEGFVHGFVSMRDVHVASPDLNGDGIPEILVRLEAGYYCGNGPCPILFFRLRDGEWTLFDEGSGSYYVSDEWENGHRVLYDLGLARSWDGNEYDYDYDRKSISVEAYIASEHHFNPGYVPPERLAELARQMAGTQNIMSVMMHPKVWPELERLLGPERADFIRRVRFKDEIEVSGPFMLASGGAAYGWWPRPRVATVVDVRSGAVDAPIEFREESGDDAVVTAIKVYTDRTRYADLPALLRSWIEPRVGDVATEVFLVRPVDEAAIVE